MGSWNKQDLVINEKHHFERIFEVQNQVMETRVSQAIFFLSFCKILRAEIVQQECK